MEKAVMRYLVLLSVVIFSLLLNPCYAITIDKMIVFGDSLSDNGNIFSLTTTAHSTIPMIPVIPKNPPYFQGRFSNGFNWADNLAAGLHVPLSDYAYGGAWVEPYHDSGLLIPFSLNMQVNFYLVSAALDTNKAQHLYVIWAGSNDYVQGREDADYATTNTVSVIQNQIDWLVYYGAKNFLILNVPDLSTIPEVVEKGPEYAAMIKKLSEMHNGKLVAMVNKEQADHADVKFMYGDVTSYMSDIITHPDKYLLKNVTDACYGGDYSYALQAGMLNAREISAAKESNIDIVKSPDLRAAYVTAKLAASGALPCQNPDEYFFWDHIHPTRIVHHIISTVILSHLPEYGVEVNNSYS